MEEELELDAGAARTEGERPLRGAKRIWEGGEGAALWVWWVM